MISLTNKEKKLHCEQKVCYISKKEFNGNDKKYYTGKKKNSDWINERRIRRKKYDRICSNLTENIFLLNG